MRKKLLFCGFAGVVALLAYALDRQEAPPQLPNSPVPTGSRGSDGAVPDLKVPARAALGKPRGELFSAPPAPQAPLASSTQPPSPAAPPNPYRFAGKSRQGNHEQLFVTKGEGVVAVQEGDTLEGGYRVAAITPTHIELVYLPLGITERVPVASVLETDPGPVQPRIPAPPATASAAKPTQNAAAPAQLRWEGPELVRAGASFSVALRMTYDQPLRAAPMQLRFEPGVLEPLSVRPGKFFGQGGFSYRVNQGAIFVGATSPGNAPGADAELLVVTFKSIKAGTTAELDMTSLSLQGAAGRSIAHAQLSPFKASITQ